MSKVRYKYCIVPQCKNTTIKTPNKLFFSVPVGEEIRKEWCSAVGRVPGVHRTLSIKCTRFVCEDHFDLDKDMYNYQMWKLVGVGKLILKKGILPHKFDCQRKNKQVEKIRYPHKLRTGHESKSRSREKDKIKTKNGKASRKRNKDSIINSNIYEDLKIEIKEEKIINSNIYEDLNKERNKDNIINSNIYEDLNKERNQDKIISSSMYEDLNIERNKDNIINSNIYEDLNKERNQDKIISSNIYEELNIERNKDKIINSNIYKDLNKERNQDKIINSNIYEYLNVKIKEEKMENDTCEQKTSIVNKDEVKPADNILYFIKYDRETGGEYLIKVDKTNGIKSHK